KYRARFDVDLVDIAFAQPAHDGWQIDTLSVCRHLDHFGIAVSQARGFSRIRMAGKYPYLGAIENTGVFIDFQPRIDDGFDRRTRGLDMAYIQLRIIGLYRAGPCQHDATASAPMMAIGACGGTCNPL